MFDISDEKIQTRQLLNSAIAIVVLCGVTIYFHITFDLMVLLFFFCSFWCLGSFLPKADIATKLEKQLIRIAVGMAIFGLLSYYLLLIGWGVRSIYIILLMLPIAVRLFKAVQQGNFKLPALPTFSTKTLIWLTLAVIVFLFFVAYASAPISKYDALTGHLPITLYAARNGYFNINVCESTAYSQTGMFFYAFSTVLAEFGAYKAMTVLNAVLFMLIIATSIAISKHLFEKTKVVIVVILFITVPMFFEFSTVMYVEMLPIYMAFSAFLMFCDFNPHKCWVNMPYIALLFGCAVISKLTICYTLLFPGIIAIIIYLCNCGTKEVAIQQSIMRFCVSGVIFAVVVAVPYIWAWYWYGNPVYPLFNGEFLSPYFPHYNFVDPFQSNELTFSVKSLMDITFHTSKNIEMYDGGMGIILLLVPIIPIGWILNRKKAFILWSIIPFCAYCVSNLFTYNLRYSMAIFMMLAIVIGVALSVIINRVSKRHSAVIAVVIAGLIAIPGLNYIEKYYDLLGHMRNVSDEICVSPISDLIREIPVDKYVLSSEPFKGDYEGYFAPTNWHSSAWREVIKNEGQSAINYAKNFDYFICDETNEEDVNLLSKCTSKEIEIVFLKSEGKYSLYKMVNNAKESDTICVEAFEEPVVSKVSAAITSAFDVTSGKYSITQDIENPNLNEEQIRFQINWYDSQGTFLGCSLELYTLKAGERKVNELIDVVPLKGAKTGVLYVGPNEDRPVNVYGYDLEVSLSDIEKNRELVESRVLL